MFSDPICGAQTLDTPGGKGIVVALSLVVMSLLKGKEESIKMEANSDDRIEDIQEKIKPHLEFSDNYHRLVFKETTLEKNRLISDYAIGDGATLLIQKRYKNGLPFEFTNFKNQEEISFSSTAPAWRTLCRGLNLEGTCVNGSCEACNKKVWIQKGFGTFSMEEEVCESVCPMCAKEVKGIKECGFFYCKYRIKGRKVDDTQVNITDSHNEKTGFRKFLAGGEHSAQYKYLKIIVTEHQE